MAKNRQRIPWSRNLTEGVLIVVSILLAFGIEAWWAGYIEREAKVQMDQRFLPLIWDYVPVVTLDLVALPDIYSDVVTPSRFSRRYDELFAERRFENAVEERMNSSRRAAERMGVAQEKVAKILALLDRELAGSAY